MLDLGLNGKVAIITGGSDGLGRASAEKLAAEGVKVAIAARRKEHLEKAADEIRKTTGGQVLEAAKFITSIGAKVERIVAVIDRQEGARENIESAGFAFDSLFTKADLGITS